MRDAFEKIRRRMVRQKRTYIMPTMAGALFLAADIILILTAATYNNNLIFILAFFLFAVFSIVLLQTHYNIKGVRLEFTAGAEGFAEDTLAMNVEIYQTRPRTKFHLRARVGGRLFGNVQPADTNLSAREMRKVVPVLVRATKRGVFSAPEMILETSYPLGLFRAWKVFRPEAQITVFPQPVGTLALAPEKKDFGDEELGVRPSPEGDFGELKAYLEGESYHQIAWKQYARTLELFSKVHWGEEHPHFEIPWRPSGDYEAYLKQMSEWVRFAIANNASFAMELPQAKIDTGIGVDHGLECWRALARLKRGA